MIIEILITGTVDDGTLVGTRQSLIAVLDYLHRSEVLDLGLKLNLRKCEVWWPSGDQTFAFHARSSACQQRVL